MLIFVILCLGLDDNIPPKRLHSFTRYITSRDKLPQSIVAMFARKIENNDERMWPNFVHEQGRRTVRIWITFYFHISGKKSHYHDFRHLHLDKYEFLQLGYISCRELTFSQSPICCPVLSPSPLRRFQQDGRPGIGSRDIPLYKLYTAVPIY